LQAASCKKGSRLQKLQRSGRQAAAVAGRKKGSSGKRPVEKSGSCYCKLREEVVRQGACEEVVGRGKTGPFGRVRKVNSQNPLLTVVVRIMFILAANLYANLNSGLTARAKEKFSRGEL
jgi:hypothetical protein